MAAATATASHSGGANEDGQPTETLRCGDIAEVKKGDHFTLVQSYVVVEKNSGNVCARPTLDMKSGANTTMIDDDVFKTTCSHASNYSRSEKVSRTALASILREQASGYTYSVRFKKKKTRADIVKNLELIHNRTGGGGGSTNNNADSSPHDRLVQGLRALLKEIENASSRRACNTLIDNTFLNGETRNMVARSLGTTTEQGRFNVIDMEIAAKEGTETNARRQIDPRTIERLVLGGVEYTLH